VYRGVQSKDEYKYGRPHRQTEKRGSDKMKRRVKRKGAA
jgi:hypothetical protein